MCVESPIFHDVYEDVKNDTVQKDRLLQLADHLENGKLGHKHFNFSTYNDFFSDQADVEDQDLSYHEYMAKHNRCGTAGCAIGEMPFLDPENWGFSDGGFIPSLKCLLDTRDFEQMDTAKFSGMAYFGISMYEYVHLFVPNSQSPSIYGGKHLAGKVKKEDVAAGIRAYLDSLDPEWEPGTEED